MAEQEEVIAHVPITITVDVEELLSSHLEYRTVNVGSFDDPEPGYISGDGQIIDVVADKLAARLSAEVTDAVRAAVKGKALEKVDALIDEIMTTPITLTSTYGEPKSPEMSMREAMIEAMTDRLDMSVDSSGKKLDRYNSRDGKPYLQWRAEQTARAVIDKEMTDRCSAAAKQIKSATNDLVGKRIAEMLGRGF